MAKTITIEPVTRIEGHAKITIDLDINGKVEDASLHVLQYRGFEKFCEGRLYSEMPMLTARTCGICPVSHVIASTKACDELISVTSPKRAINIRKIVNLAQIIQSHALSFFHLSSADLVYGFDAPKEQRNIFHLLKSDPQIAKDGIRLRAFGQKIIENLGGKKIHPTNIVAGGVLKDIDSQTKQLILEQLPQMLEIVQNATKFFVSNMHKYQKEIEFFGTFETMFMAIKNQNSTLEHYDGLLCFIDKDGNIVEENINPKDYKNYICEQSEDSSYLKSPYYKPLGYELGNYRVGALARLNIASSCGTSMADLEFERFKNINNGKPVLNSFYYHYARLIEIIFALEKIEELVNSHESFEDSLRSYSNINNKQAVGCSEAPRGTLIHDYEVTKDGIITAVNLIIATGNNSISMNKAVKQVAQNFIDPNDITDGALNRVEAVIRCFDPCLSCSTHALGVVSSSIYLRDHQKQIIKTIDRS